MWSLYKTNWLFIYSLSYFSTPLSPGTEIKNPPRLLKMMVLYGGIKMNTCDRFCCYDWVICLCIINEFLKYYIYIIYIICIVYIIYIFFIYIYIYIYIYIIAKEVVYNRP